MELEIIDSGENITRVALRGRLDIGGVDQVETKFTGTTAARRKNTIVDLSEVSFLASMGLRMLISTAKALKMHGAKMVLLNPQKHVADTLKTVVIDQIIGVANNEQDALALLQEA